MFKKIALAATIAILSTGAFAADGQIYAGADIGTTKIDGVNDRENGYGVFVGYAITPTIAIEAGFRRLADYDLRTNGVNGSLTMDQISLSGVATLPLSNNFSVFGRLGYSQLKAKASFGGSSGSDSDNGAVYGVGVGYAFSPTVSARAELQKPSSDATSFNVGVAFKF
ncbi:MAG: porin family protein [Bdellovibrionales bacterium]|nr:porin family protein [Massilia sp.]